MTTLQQVELQCPICETRFRSQIGGFDELVRRQANGLSRTRGGYAAAALPDSHVQSLRLLRRGSRFHGRSGRFAGAQGACVERARAVHHLRHDDGFREVRSRGQGCGVAGNGSATCGRSAAARCVVLRGRRRHRSRAVLPSKSGVEVRGSVGSFDGVARDERAVLTYLVGELWRRVGDTKLATPGCQRVGSEIIDAQTQQWVIDAARQQRDCPREWFG